MQEDLYRIAPVGPSDIEDIVRLFHEYESHIGVDLTYQDFASELATLPGKYAPPAGQLLVARDARQSAIGCVALRPLNTRTCEMKRLFVSPDGRGLGLGRALASAIIEEATRLGYAEIRLDTLPSMQAAIGLYKELGFVPIDPYYEGALRGSLFMARRL